MKRVKGIVLVIVLLVVVLGVVLVVNAKRNVVIIEKGDTEVVTTKMPERDTVIQLSAPAGSEEEAKEIADMYGITYRGFYRGYGQYETEKSYTDLKNVGIENNFPELEILYKSFTK